MRKLLLFIFVTSLFVVGSCSKDKDEESIEVSPADKKYLVKQTLIEFNNSAVKTGKYEVFISSVAQKSALGQLSPAELEELWQEFLGDQTQAFLDVYYQLVALNITPEEFISIANQFEYLRSDILRGLGKNSKSPCGISDAELFRVLISWVFGCEQA
ncbi:hypothetical protein [Aquimarina algiphila]|uniref:hypothetical protein n=1 Tax=Aquimarina algiphila TaxID=2047982 RepID=UPI00248FFDDB|nr:hypothetical protein [Aquimarina algiphila]